MASETVVADVPNAVLTLATANPLPVPGASAVYRAILLRNIAGYVVLSTGNERGSNNAAVLRV